MSLNDRKKLAYNSEKLRKIKEIKNNELNKECFDCGSCYPEYISINNGVFICKDCLIVHNKFPKLVSNTLKNNLSSLNSKELQFMYLGGNQKLLEFINYEYPQLQKFKINILYQTKAMQYYRNNLNYLVNGGIKPIKPNEKINAYELIDINEEISKNEKIKIKEKNTTKSMKEKRNKSVARLDTSIKKIKREKENVKTCKRAEKKRKCSNNDSEDNLKRHKSFYKEMNKLFGDDADIEFNDLEGERKSCKIERKKKEIFDKKSDYTNKIRNKLANNNKNKLKNKPNLGEHPVEHIHNNNYFTLSATKNIFMFTSNKDSIIYKHRKINTINNNIPDEIDEIKEIYSKPKISYIINTNPKKKHNNLFFSLKENRNNKNELNLYDDNVYDLNKENYINFKSTRAYKAKNFKNKKDEIYEDTNSNKKLEIDNIDIKYNTTINPLKNKKEIEKKENNTFNNTDIQEGDNNAIFTKKRISKLMRKDKQIKENENKLIKNEFISNKKLDNFILLRNEKKKKNLNNEINNKTELKFCKNNKIINNLNNDNQKENNKNNDEEIKSKTFTEIKDNYNKKIYI